MSWRDYVIRALAGSAIAIALIFKTHPGSLVQFFAISVAVTLGSHGVLLGIKLLAGESKRSFVVLAACVVVAAAAVVFVVIDTEGPTEYVRFRRVDELMHYPGGNVGPFFKVHGFVAHGSAMRGGDKLRFTLEENGSHVDVETTAVVPDAFREGAEVVVVGHLRRAGGMSSEFVFVADEVNAKCPSTYQTKDGPRPAAEFR
jgi:cytochrome c-type biogenesis protein CcmE